MDRRRFVPTALGLESRALLSVVAAGRSTNPTVQTQAQSPSQIQLQAGSLPESYSQKIQRIENLPFFLEQLQPGRYLSSTTVEEIQTNLEGITAKLHAPSTGLLDQFNSQVRDVLAEKTLSQEQARSLNSIFGQILTSAGATPVQVTTFQASMNQQALGDSQSPNPTYLAANDYAVVLQTAMAVGRPIQTPRPPRLAPSDGNTSSNGLIGSTTKSQPSFLGTYEPGASDNGSTRIEILDSSGTVIGSGVVESNGRYTAQVSTPLAEGQYTLQARAVDSLGNQSNLTGNFFLRVLASPGGRSGVAAQILVVPKGPMGLRRS